jgi:hypothetical protein
VSNLEDARFHDKAVFPRPDRAQSRFREAAISSLDWSGWQRRRADQHASNNRIDRSARQGCREALKVFL